jgi:hypothetical protein
MLALALAALTLAPPVPGVIERPFAYEGDPFARGHHRGVDLAAAPGTPVRAACSGRVTFAGRAGAGAVAIRCGRFSVTHLPLHPAVRAGDRVAAGAPLGTVARSREHEGLHLGVRTASDRLGYVDPAPLLRDRRPPALPVAPRAITRRPAPIPPHPAPLPSAPRAAPLPHAAPPPQAAPPPRAAPLPGAAPRPRAAPPSRGTTPAHHPGSSPLAPWPVWAGLALLLAGVTGAGAAKRARKRRAALAQPRAAPVR